VAIGTIQSGEMQIEQKDRGKTNSFPPRGRTPFFCPYKFQVLWNCTITPSHTLSQAFCFRLRIKSLVSSETFRSRLSHDTGIPGSPACDGMSQPLLSHRSIPSAIPFPYAFSEMCPIGPTSKQFVLKYFQNSPGLWLQCAPQKSFLNFL
jgi:hypothetical protein